MQALVTGGGGFLGKAIAVGLVARGDRVVSLARGPYPELAALGIRHLRGDVCDPEAVVRAAQGCDVVFHTAAKAGMWGRPEEYRRINVGGTENVLAACRKLGISKLVYTSSPSVVHAGGDLAGCDESLPYPDHFEGPYPATKAEAERMALAADGPDLMTVALRPHLIWGPGDNHIVPRLIDRARSGRLFRIKGGPYLVDSVYIDNASEAHLQACDRLEPGSPLRGRAYFISQGEPTDVFDLIERIVAAAGLGPLKKSVSPRTAYLAGAMFETVFRLFRIDREPPMTRFIARQMTTAHWFDLTAARRDLGYNPKITIAEGLERLREHLAEAARSK